MRSSSRLLVKDYLTWVGHCEAKQPQLPRYFWPYLSMTLTLTLTMIPASLELLDVRRSDQTRPDHTNCQSLGTASRYIHNQSQGYVHRRVIVCRVERKNLFFATVCVLFSRRVVSNARSACQSRRTNPSCRTYGVFPSGAPNMKYTPRTKA